MSNSLVKGNLHAIRLIFWQDCVKRGKGKTISLILGWLLRPMADVFNKKTVKRQFKLFVQSHNTPQLPILSAQQAVVAIMSYDMAFLVCYYVIIRGRF